MSRCLKKGCLQIAVLGCFIFLINSLLAEPIPFLQKHGTAVQLMVQNKPFLVLGGELGNSSASSSDYMEPIWPRLGQMNLNTVLVPVYWELIEPQEGQFDWSSVDDVIKKARAHDLRIILLWFGSWKNSMSCYVPAWIKTDSVRFARAQLQSGRPVEALTPFSRTNLEADKKAVTGLMRHLDRIDSKTNTVIMVQVENEIGMLENARDYSSAAEDAFGQPVPTDLIDYLAARKGALAPDLEQTWKQNGFKTSGSWEDVFGRGLCTDEFFMAWHYARYVEEIAAAGKNEYALPMFVNAALIRPGYKPGQYPSAGPLPHLMDIWQAAAPSIDLLSPDIYFSNFADWSTLFHTDKNPLFIPEASREPDAAVHVLYAIGAHDAIGFSPFSIEDNSPQDPLTAAYGILAQLSPLIFERQGMGQLEGFLLDKEHPTMETRMGGCIVKVSHDYTWAWSKGPKDSAPWPRAGGLAIMLDKDELLFAGSGIIVTFAPADGRDQAGILTIEEGTFNNNRWIRGRILNGDQSHQGRHLRIPYGSYEVQRVRLYTY